MFRYLTHIRASVFLSLVFCLLAPGFASAEKAEAEDFNAELPKGWVHEAGGDFIVFCDPDGEGILFVTLKAVEELDLPQMAKEQADGQPVKKLNNGYAYENANGGRYWIVGHEAAFGEFHTVKAHADIPKILASLRAENAAPFDVDRVFKEVNAPEVLDWLMFK